MKRTPAYPIIAALLATAHHLPAATYTWTGTTSGAWDTATPANWGGVGPTFNNQADLVFDGATPIVTYITYLGGAPRTARSITFQGTFTSPLEIRTNANNATARMLNLTADAGNATLNVNASINQLITIGQGTGADNNGTVSLGSDLSVVHNGTANLTIQRPVNESVAGRSITKSGTGTLLLSGVNTYSGSTTINAGILRLGNAAGLGATSGDTVVNAGGTLDVNNNTIPAGESVSIAGAGHNGMGALFSNTGNTGTETRITDGLTLTADASVGCPAGIRYGLGHNGSATTGMFTLTKVGAGQFDLRGPVTIGDIVVQQGIFQTEGVANYNAGLLTLNAGTELRVFEIVNPFPRNIVATDAKIFNGGSTLNGDTLAGSITLNGSCTVESNGGQTTDKLILAGIVGEGSPNAALTIGGIRRVVMPSANTYTGLTTVNALASLELSGSLTSPIAVAATGTLDGEGMTTQAITFANDANLQFNPGTTGADQHLRAADVIVAPGEVVKVTATAASAGTSAIVLRDGNGGLDLTNFILTGASRGTLSLGGTGGNSDLIYNFQPGNLEWRGFTDSFWGTDDGANNFQNLGTNAPDDFLGRDNVDFVDTATGDVTLIGNILAGTVSFKNTAGHDVNILTGAETLDAFSLTTTSSGNVNIGVPLAGATAVTVGGSGTLTLAGNNTNSGAMTVNSGKLVLSGTNAIAGILTLNAGILQVGTGGTTGAWPGGVANGGSVIFNRSDNLNYNGVITGSGTLTKEGTGTLTLGGNSTFTGLTTVNAGILQIGNGAGGTVGGDVLVEASGVLDFNRGDTSTYAGSVSGTGVVNKRAPGILTLTGNNSFSGGLNIYNGTLIAGDAQLGSGPITMGPGMANVNTLSLTGSTDNDIFFANGGTANKVINLAAGTTDATLSGTIHFDTDSAAAAGVARISPLAGGTITVTGKMTGNGLAGYAKRNPGTVIIANTTNDYTGPTHIVDPGLLLVNGRVPGHVFFGEALGVGGTGAVNGTLGGSGVIGGNVKLQNNSKLSPGGTSAAGVNADTQATLTINGDLDASLIGGGNGRIIMQLDALAGTNDRVNVGNILALGAGTVGLTEFTFTNAGGLETGSYTLISAAGGITGTLDAADVTGEIAPGLTGTLAISGNDLVLTIGGANPYAAWTSGFPGLTDTGFDVDFDGDGIATGLEWVLGGNPTVNDAAAIAPTIAGSAATGITLSFRREEDSIGAATLIVEYGATIGNPWPKSVTIAAASSGPDVNGVTVTVNDGTDPDTVTVNIPATNAGQGKLFARLKATMP